MARSIRNLNRSLFALGVFGALTFGAAQAFAAPAKDAADRPYCDPVKCNEQCGGYGICSGFTCLCY